MTDKENPEIWLYEAGTWRRAPDPITWQGGDDVHERYAEAGYTESYTPEPFIGLVYPGDVPGTVGLALWVRDKAPQCIIDIEGTNDVGRSVYVDRFPDALDLMAQWAPLVSVSAPIAEAVDAYQRQQANRSGASSGGRHEPP